MNMNQCFCHQNPCLCVLTHEQIIALENESIKHIDEIQKRFPYDDYFREHPWFENDLRKFDDAAKDVIRLPDNEESVAIATEFFPRKMMMHPSTYSVKHNISGREKSLDSINYYRDRYNHIIAVNQIVALVLRIKRLLPMNEHYQPNPMAFYTINNSPWDYYAKNWDLSSTIDLYECLIEN